MTEDSKDLEKITTKISSLQKKVEISACSEWTDATIMNCCIHCEIMLQKNDAIKNIAELGSLPSEAFEKYLSLSSKQVRISFTFTLLTFTLY